MRKEDFYEALGEIDEAAVAEAAVPSHSKRRVKTVIIAAAAAACIVIGAGVFLARPGVVISDPDTSEAASAAESPAATDNGAADSSSEDTSKAAASKPLPEKIVQAETDRVVYSDLPSLLEASQLVVIGEYAEETEQKLTTAHSAEINADVITNAVSTNKIHIKKVLKGEPPEGDITVSQRYGIQDEPAQIVTFSSLTPMVKGDEWLFFLYYDALGSTYWCAGDYCGRYPIPNDEILAELDSLGENGLLDIKTLGVLDGSSNTTSLYREIIKHFGDELRV